MDGIFQCKLLVITRWYCWNDICRYSHPDFSGPGLLSWCEDCCFSWPLAWLKGRCFSLPSSKLGLSLWDQLVNWSITVYPCLSKVFSLKLNQSHATRKPHWWSLWFLFTGSEQPDHGAVLLSLGIAEHLCWLCRPLWQNRLWSCVYQKTWKCAWRKEWTCMQLGYLFPHQLLRYLAGLLPWYHSQVLENVSTRQVQWMFFMQSLWPCNPLERWRLGLSRAPESYEVSAAPPQWKMMTDVGIRKSCLPFVRFCWYLFLFQRMLEDVGGNSLKQAKRGCWSSCQAQGMMRRQAPDWQASWWPSFQWAY